MYRLTFFIIILASSVFGQNHVEVIYPEEGQQIASVDSTFIFGNTGPRASLTINGFDIAVHKDGGFLAFLPVEAGEFEFELVSDLEGDMAVKKLKVTIGGAPPDKGMGFIDTSSILPRGRTVFTDEEMLQFSFSALAGGRSFCRFSSDSAWIPMYGGENGPASRSVFGDIAAPGPVNRLTEYTGYLPSADIEDSSRIHFLYERDVLDTSGVLLSTEFELDSTGFFIVNSPSVVPRVLELTGRPRIIRVGPGQGYKLVNQPAGVRFWYAGETPDYYLVALADGMTGYMRKADAKLLAEGTRPPSGEVSFIRFDDYPGYVELSMALGDMLPYEIHTDGNLMTIDLFYLISDTDWIRFNGRSREYIESAWWSQPQDGIYRLNITWYDSHFWGFDPYYDGEKFILKLVKSLDHGDDLDSPVKGLRIVIDPGHSHDAGAKGPTGLPEKNANLWIAHELRQILLKKGAEVLMTRMGHEHVGLYDRVDIADKWDADLLISIHNNALPDGINPFKHNGTSVYYYFNQARPLAEAIHKHLVKATGLPDHGLYYGNLALCRFSECPSVLVECAFMMLPEQEAMLKTDKFQRKCAKAIYEGICDYVRGK